MVLFVRFVCRSVFVTVVVFSLGVARLDSVFRTLFTGAWMVVRTQILVTTVFAAAMGRQGPWCRYGLSKDLL